MPVPILCLRILSTFAHYFLHMHTQAQYSTVYSLTGLQYSENRKAAPPDIDPAIAAS